MSGNISISPLKVQSFIIGGHEPRKFDLPAAAQLAGAREEEKVGVSDPAWMCGPDFKF